MAAGSEITGDMSGHEDTSLIDVCGSMAAHNRVSSLP